MSDLPERAREFARIYTDNAVLSPDGKHELRQLLTELAAEVERPTPRCITYVVDFAKLAPGSIVLEQQERRVWRIQRIEQGEFGPVVWWSQPGGHKTVRGYVVNLPALVLWEPEVTE